LNLGLLHASIAIANAKGLLLLVHASSGTKKFVMIKSVSASFDILIILRYFEVVVSAVAETIIARKFGGCLSQVHISSQDLFEVTYSRSSGLRAQLS
jgi:hypothetical protein